MLILFSCSFRYLLVLLLKLFVLQLIFSQSDGFLSEVDFDQTAETSFKATGQFFGFGQFEFPLQTLADRHFCYRSMLQLDNFKLYASQFVRAILCSDEFVDLQIAFLHNPANLSIFSGSHGDVQPTVGAQLAIDVHQQWTILFAFDHYRRVHDLQLAVCYLSVDFHPIKTGQFCLRMLQQTFECVIIGNQQQSLGIVIQATYRHEIAKFAANLRRKKLVNGFSFLWIAMSAYVSSRFVDHPQFCYRLCYLQSRGRQCLKIGLSRNQHVLVDALAVDSDQSQFDKLLGFTAGADRLETEPLRQANCSL